ncbi:MAG: helix-turn-helix domain-containing protein [Armatimonadota bacterium]
MANYDNRLGEWFKQVERSAQELKKKKTDDGHEEEQQSFPEVEQHAAVSRVEITRQPTDEALSMERLESAVATMDTSEILIDEGSVGEPRAHSERPSQGLFDDADIPAVEDFFSFLSHKSEPATEESMNASSEIELTQSRPLIRLGEGTGDPRPLEDEGFTEPIVQPKAIYVPPVVQEVAPTPTALPASDEPIIAREPEAQGAHLQENWDRMPHHLQTLFGVAGEEVAQNSYKAFKESRGDLIQRLLDPPLTLEEAARILNVCPTTVRRYTNRGVLTHFRTAGNQRRFRLSDVLSFMESNGGQTGE